MKTHYLIAALAAFGALALGASPASARDWYVKAEVGQTLDTQVEGIELNDGPTFGGYVGTAAGPLRLELGVAHASASTNVGIEIDGSAVIYNSTAYLDTASGFYAGVGVDYAQAEASIGPFFQTDTQGFGYHASVGYAWAFGPLVAEVQYTYRDINTDNVDISGGAVTLAGRVPLQNLFGRPDYTS